MQTVVKKSKSTSKAHHDVPLEKRKPNYNEAIIRMLESGLVTKGAAIEMLARVEGMTE